MSVKQGRPRDSRLDAAVLSAAEELLLTHGFGALTFDRLAAAAGTSRPALYRRWANKTALATELLIARFGTDPAPNLGSLRADLLAVQSQQLAFFEDPLTRAGLIGVLSELAAEPEAATRFHEAFMAPRRVSTAEILHRAVARGEITEYPKDPQPIFDILTGPLLLRSILPGLGPIDQTLLDATVDSVVALLDTRA